MTSIVDARRNVSIWGGLVGTGFLCSPPVVLVFCGHTGTIALVDARSRCSHVHKCASCVFIFLLVLTVAQSAWPPAADFAPSQRMQTNIFRCMRSVTVTIRQTLISPRPMRRWHLRHLDREDDAFSTLNRAGFWCIIGGWVARQEHRCFYMRTQARVRTRACFLSRVEKAKDRSRGRE